MRAVEGDIYSIGAHEKKIVKKLAGKTIRGSKRKNGRDIRNPNFQ